MKNFKLLGSSLTIALVSASAAFAAAPPAGNVTSTGGTATTGTFVAGSSPAVVSPISGNPAAAPFQTTYTTTSSGSVNTSLATAAISSSGTVNSVPYTLTGTAGATAVSGATSVITTTTTYSNPTTSPLTLVSVSGVTAPTVVGSTSSVSGITVQANTANANAAGGVAYAANVDTVGAITGNTRGVVENDLIITTSGTTYSTYNGTATYTAGTPGSVAVVMGATPVSSTSLTSSGLTTTGTVTAATLTGATVNAGVLNANTGGVAGAAGINAGNGRITNLSAGTGPSDAVNYAQLTATNANVTALSGTVTTLASLVSNNRLHADRGIATAVALSGGAFLPNKKFNLTVNVGGYESQAAVAAQVGILLSENIAINAGVSTSLKSDGGTAYRGGITFGF
ncbi:MAG: YadA-like family protein [Novosphingobium sp.]